MALVCQPHSSHSDEDEVENVWDFEIEIVSPLKWVALGPLLATLMENITLLPRMADGGSSCPSQSKQIQMDDRRWSHQRESQSTRDQTWERGEIMPFQGEWTNLTTEVGGLVSRNLSEHDQKWSCTSNAAILKFWVAKRSGSVLEIKNLSRG